MSVRRATSTSTAAVPLLRLVAAAALASCVACITTPVGNYIPSVDVTQYLDVSNTVYDIVSDLYNLDFSGAEAKYKSNAVLLGYGKGQGLSGTVFDLFKTYFGSSASFNDDFINQSLALSINSAAKMEMVMKTIWDAIPVQAILSLTKAGSSPDDWDRAAALYLGNRTKASSPYDRANKRAANYGTFASGSKTEAAVNVDMISALNSKNSTAVERAIKILYAQAATRYTRLIDNYATSNPPIPTDVLRAEGQAFYRIIAPFVKQADAECDTMMKATYDLSGPINADGLYYCKALACVPRALGISNSELGTLEGTEGTCTGPGAAGATIATPVGDYTPSTAVWEQMGVSKTVSVIVDAVEKGDFDSAKQNYLANTYLVRLAKGEGLSGSSFDLSSAYFGSRAFNDYYLMNEAFPNKVDAAKGEMIEKTVMDTIPVQAILSLTSSSSDENWDKAAALYLGMRPLEKAPYDRANFRASNYGTLVPNTGDPGEAAVNQAMLVALNAKDQRAVLKQIQILYAQATIRYAHLLDIDLTSVPQLSTDYHRAEGQAFYRIIAPFVKQQSPSCDSTVKAIFDMSTPLNSEGQYYCDALACITSALGISSSELGTLEETEGKCSESAPSPNISLQDASNSMKLSIFSALATTMACYLYFALKEDI